MSTDTRTAASQWVKTQRRFHCPRRTKVPAWDAFGGARVVATETNVKHARPERPLGDILIAEGDTFWANPDTPKIRELLSTGRIQQLAESAPAPDATKVHGDGLAAILDSPRLISTLRSLGIDTPDQLAAAYVEGELKGKPGIGKAFYAEIGEALVTDGLILASDLAA